MPRTEQRGVCILLGTFASNQPRTLFFFEHMRGSEMHQIFTGTLGSASAFSGTSEMLFLDSPSKFALCFK